MRKYFENTVWIVAFLVVCAFMLNEAIRAADIFGVFEKILWLKIAHFTADFAIVVRGIEGLNPANTALAFKETFPKRLEIIPDRGDNTEACDNNSTVIHKVMGDG